MDTRKPGAGLKAGIPGYIFFQSDPNRQRQALNELPHPQVDLVFGLLNLKPEPSIDST